MSNRKNPQTAGRKRKATKKTRRNMRRQTKKVNNMRRQRGGGLKEDAKEALKSIGVNPTTESYDNFVFNSGRFRLGGNGQYNTVIVGDYTFKKVKAGYNTYTLYVFKTTDPSKEELIYSDRDGVSGIY